jgi:hypothetical protein
VNDELENMKKLQCPNKIYYLMAVWRDRGKARNIAVTLKC